MGAMGDAGFDDLVRRHALVRLRRSVGGLPPYVGIVLGTGPDLVLLRDVEETGLGGFTVLRRASVENLRRSWMERDRERRVLAAAGAAGLDPPFAVDLASWSRLFRSLLRAGIEISTEREHPRRFRYMTGRVVHVNGATVSLRWPRALPSPAAETERTLFADITRVAFA